MANYIRGGSSNFGSIIQNAPNLVGVQVDTIGETLFVAYNYRNSPRTATLSPPTWNGEAFTEIVSNGDIPPDIDSPHWMQVFYLTTASTGTFDILASNAESVVHSAVWGLYSNVTAITPIENEEQWFSSGYTNPSLTVTGTGTVLNIFAPQNWAEGFTPVLGTTWSVANGQNLRQSVQNTNVEGGWAYLADIESTTSQTVGWTPSAALPAYIHTAIFIGGAAGPSIDTYDDPIRLGTTSAHTVSNFSGPITSAIISRDGISVAATSVSDTQATWPALAQSLVIPACGTGATLTLSDGTDSANVTIEFLPEVGFTWRDVLTVSGSLIEGDWGFSLGLESNQDGYITRDSDAGIATHNNDGSTTWLDYATSLVYSWDKNAIVGNNGGLTSITLNNLETGPVLTLPTGTATGQTTASGTVTTDEGNGTLYYLASVNASESSGTIKAASSQAITATGIQNVTVTGLTASTNYYLHYVQTNTLLEDSNVASSAQFTTDAIQAPILASTKALSGVIDQSFTKTLTIQGGDPATSWLITGGADQAEYSLNNSGVLTRDVPNPLEESEVITVTASNAGGTSNTQTVTITYGTESGTRRKRKKTMLRNFYYFREEWEKMSERNKDRD